MAVMTYDEAVWSVIVDEMRRDPTVFVYGWPEGERFTRTGPSVRPAVEEFGRDRIPFCGIEETQIAGAAVGAALVGARPIVDLQKPEMAMDGWGQLAITAAEARWRIGYNAPLRAVFIVTWGAYRSRNGHDHSGCYHNWLANAPGLLVACPSTAADAAGLMKTTLTDVIDPVAFLMHIPSQTIKGEVPDLNAKIPFGKADVKRQGQDVTIAAIGWMVDLALEAAEELAGSGISAEVWDPRTLTPFDRQSLIDSVSKTKALVIVDQGGKSFGATGEFAMTIAEAMSPVPPMRRVTTLHACIAASAPVEDYMLPTKGKIVSAVQDVLTYKGTTTPGK